MSAVATPQSAERQPRVIPTASTMVSASTISTAEARKAPANNRKSCTSPPEGCSVRYGRWRSRSKCYRRRSPTRSAPGSPTSRPRSGGSPSTFSSPGRKGRSARRPRSPGSSAPATPPSSGPPRRWVTTGSPTCGARSRHRTHDHRSSNGCVQTLEETPPDELLTACITHHRSDVDLLARLVPPPVFEQAVDILSASAASSGAAWVRRLMSRATRSSCAGGSVSPAWRWSRPARRSPTSCWRCGPTTPSSSWRTGACSRTSRCCSITPTRWNARSS